MMSDADFHDWIAFFLCQDEDEQETWKRRNGIHD